jgi:hypothetical protein
MSKSKQYGAPRLLACSISLTLLCVFVLSTGCASPKRAGSLTATDYFERGIKKRRHHDLDGAAADFKKAIALKSDYAKAYDELGVVDVCAQDGGTTQDRVASAVPIF